MATRSSKRPFVPNSFDNLPFVVDASSPFAFKSRRHTANKLYGASSYISNGARHKSKGKGEAKKAEAASNQQLIDMEDKLKTLLPKLSQKPTATFNSFLSETVASALLSVEMAYADSKEVLERILEGPVDLAPARRALESAVLQALTIRALKIASSVVGLDQNESSLLRLIYFYRNVGSTGGPNEKVLSELLKVLDLHQQPQGAEVPVRPARPVEGNARRGRASRVAANAANEEIGRSAPRRGGDRRSSNVR